MPLVTDFQGQSMLFFIGYEITGAIEMYFGVFEAAKEWIVEDGDKGDESKIIKCLTPPFWCQVGL